MLGYAVISVTTFGAFMFKPISDASCCTLTICQSEAICKYHHPKTEGEGGRPGHVMDVWVGWGGGGGWAKKRQFTHSPDLVSGTPNRTEAKAIQ